MKITKVQLKQIIKEELAKLTEISEDQLIGRHRNAIQKCRGAGHEPKEIDIGSEWEPKPEHENFWCEDFIHTGRLLRYGHGYKIDGTFM